MSLNLNSFSSIPKETDPKAVNMKDKLIYLKTSIRISLLKKIAIDGLNIQMIKKTIIPSNNEHVKATSICLLVISFFCINAGAIPILENNIKKEITIPAIETTPYSAGLIFLAITMITIVCNTS